jgi:hypothetical protein
MEGQLLEDEILAHRSFMRTAIVSVAACFGLSGQMRIDSV